MAYSYGQGATATSGTDSAFPGSGTSASQDSIYGITSTLAQIPVAVSITKSPSPPLHQGLSMDPQGAGGGPPTVNVETKNWQTVLATFYQMTPDQRAQVQQQMLQAGFYPTNYYGSSPPILVPGEADAGSYTAWRNLVEATVRESAYDDKSKSLLNPKTLGDVLTERIANRSQQGVPSPSLASINATRTPQVLLTNPADIRAALIADAKTAYGHKADEGLINSVIDGYQKLEAQAQSANAANVAPSVVKPPSVDAYASQQLQNADPTGVAQHNALHAGDLVMQAFMSSLGNAPLGGSSG